MLRFSPAFLAFDSSWSIIIFLPGPGEFAIVSATSIVSLESPAIVLSSPAALLDTTELETISSTTSAASLFNSVLLTKDDCDFGKKSLILVSNGFEKCANDGPKIPKPPAKPPCKAARSIAFFFLCSKESASSIAP